MSSPGELGERRRLLGEEWAKLDAEARRLDAMEGIKLAELFIQYRSFSKSIEEPFHLEGASVWTFPFCPRNENNEGHES